MNYIVHYSALDDFGRVLKQGKMRVKNKLSELHAKTSLEDYFKKKFLHFNKLIVYKCYQDDILTQILGNLNLN